MRIKEMAVARSSPIWKKKGRLKKEDEMEGRTWARGQEIVTGKGHRARKIK